MFNYQSAKDVPWSPPGERTSREQKKEDEDKGVEEKKGKKEGEKKKGRPQ